MCFLSLQMCSEKRKRKVSVPTISDKKNKQTPKQKVFSFGAICR